MSLPLALSPVASWLPGSLRGFAETQPVATAFLSQALEGQALAHGLIFKGNDINGLMQIALQLAQVLNCINRPDAVSACGGCQSCRWIAANAHPSVITLSRLSYLVNASGHDADESDLKKLSKLAVPKQIKVDQITRLQAQLALHAEEYFRVVIFTDVEETSIEEPCPIPPPAEWKAIPGNDQKQLHYRPLNHSLFNAGSANRFLKTLEEPPPRTLFIFLTESEQQLMDTIVSRCQVIPFHRVAVSDDSGDLETAQSMAFSTWVRQLASERDMVAAQERFVSDILEPNEWTPLQGLQRLSAWWRNQARSGGELAQAESFYSYQQIQKAILKGIERLQAKSNSDAVLLYLCETLHHTLRR